MPPPPLPDVTLAILAGGEGRRLGGVPKGLLEVEGETVLARQLRTLAPLVAEVVLVTPRPAPYAAHRLRCVEDELPGHGAPGGLCAALSAARTGWVLAVACDMPFVLPQAVHTLAAARGPDCDAVLFEVGGHWQPLLALYRTALAAPFRACLPAHPSLRALLRQARPRVLPEDVLRQVDARLLSVQGLNTPEDAIRLGAVRPSGG